MRAATVVLLLLNDQLCPAWPAIAEHGVWNGEGERTLGQSECSGPLLMPHSAAGAATLTRAVAPAAPPRLLACAASPRRRSPTTRLKPLYSCAAATPNAMLAADPTTAGRLRLHRPPPGTLTCVWRRATLRTTAAQTEAIQSRESRLIAAVGAVVSCVRFAHGSHVSKCQILVFPCEA